MGGKQSIDPEIMRKIQESQNQIKNLSGLIKLLQEQLNQALSEGKRLKDAKLYKELKRQAFQAFIDNIQTLKFQEKIPKKVGELHYVLIGNISSGKSSLINYCCGTKLKVGLGETTLETKKVAQSKNGKVHIWDSPGVNENFIFYDPDVLAFFHSADRIFILYPDSLKSCKEMIEILNVIKPSNTFLVRTQCDRWQAGFQKTIYQQLQTDRKLLAEWNIKLSVFGTSSKKQENFLDNAKLVKFLNGYE